MIGLRAQAGLLFVEADSEFTFSGDPTEALGLELQWSSSDSAFRFFFRQVDVAAVCAAIRNWTIAQVPCGAGDLDLLICDAKTLRGSIEPTAGGGSAFIAKVSL